MKKILFLLLLACPICITSCHDDDYDDDYYYNSDSGSGSSSSSSSSSSSKVTEKNLAGTWKSLDDTSEYLYITKNNHMTFEAKKSYDGILHEDCVYKLTGDQLDYYNSADPSISYSFSVKIEGNTLLMTKGTKTWKFSRMSTTAPDVYQCLPYDSYISYGSVYYPLVSAEMTCSHAKGTEANYKFLTLRGSSDKSLKPNSVTFVYTTPYYDGINAEWRNGTYVINENARNYYTYGISACYIGNLDYQSTKHLIYGGKLKISTSGSQTTIDYKDESGIEVHFSGKM